MSTAEVANQLVAFCKGNKYLEAVETLYAEDIVSVEATEHGGSREMRGKQAVKGKNEWWFQAYEVHSASVTGPFVSPERFAVLYSFDSTRKDTGERTVFNEVAVYTVENGKIIREEFLYA